MNKSSAAIQHCLLTNSYQPLPLMYWLQLEGSILDRGLLLTISASISISSRRPPTDVSSTIRHQSSDVQTFLFAIPSLYLPQERQAFLTSDVFILCEPYDLIGARLTSSSVTSASLRVLVAKDDLMLDLPPD